MESIKNIMKICHLTTKLEFSGTEICIHNLAKFHPDKNAKITVCALTNIQDYRTVLEKDHIKVVALGMPAKNFLQVAVHTPLFLLKMCFFLKKENFDVLHIHAFLAGILGRIAGWITGVPLIIRHIHNMELDLPSRIKVEKFLHGFTHQYIANSNGVRKYAIQLGRIPEKKIKTIYYGLDVEKLKSSPSVSYEIQHNFGLNEHDLVIGTIARLTAQKGIIYLIKAMPTILHTYPKLKLLIVGRGPLRKFLEEQAKEIKVADNIIFIGEHKDTRIIYPMLDIFVLSSLWEGFGIVLLEAMFFKCPIICSKIPGPDEFIEHHKDGVLIPVKNSEALAVSILELLKSKEKRKKYTTNAYIKFTQNFYAENMTTKVQNLYSELLNHK